MKWVLIGFFLLIVASAIADSSSEESVAKSSSEESSASSSSEESGVSSEDSSESKEESEESTKELVLAEPCDEEACQLPNCRCSSTSIPGGLNPRNVPQVR